MPPWPALVLCLLSGAAHVERQTGNRALLEFSLNRGQSSWGAQSITAGCFKRSHSTP